MLVEMQKGAGQHGRVPVVATRVMATANLRSVGHPRLLDEGEGVGVGAEENRRREGARRALVHGLLPTNLVDQSMPTTNVLSERRQWAATAARSGRLGNEAGEEADGIALVVRHSRLGMEDASELLQGAQGRGPDPRWHVLKCTAMSVLDRWLDVARGCGRTEMQR